ncbi:restriction endonuclease [Pseudoxanthomonas suwonensis 11-1]|uniref:Restriction endonuclease n=1 Tax=Pseudoxanthomonas suwonensis (strain 11-1) TaxID=743721 RepID=E6WXJ8_PSEUU|nr:restriction endonuclease [Pseudoxanthomonas suwonensis]ADV28864.1 restriction endonuclease [Pseudoxanthomonas suwonensis 11-1]
MHTSDPEVRIGPTRARYTSTGKISSYFVELWHDGLGEHREIKSADLNVLESKVDAALLKWSDKWEVMKRRLELQATAESAAAESQTAQQALAECHRLLAASLAADDRINWNSLKQHPPFVWDGTKLPIIRYGAGNRPLGIQPTNKPREPDQTSFRPKIGWFHYLIPGAVSKKRAEARERWSAELRLFEQQCAEARDNDAERERAFLQQKTAFERAKAEYEQTCRASDEKIDAIRDAWLRGDQNGVTEHADLVLSGSKYPQWMKIDYSVAFEESSGNMVVDYRLPAPEETPSLERVSFVKARNERVEKHLTEAKKKTLYDSVCYQIALRTVHELFEADEANAIQAITFNGWVEAVNTANGRLERSCILSVRADKGEFLGFDLANVDPKACFKALKGVAASSLSGLAPVRPILVLDTDDSRLVPGRAVADSLDDSLNLAAMPWEDFEHLVRELFSKIFSSGGSEVHVTRASRDGGVDAIAFDPDPIKGGKIVIQAKRYTNVVGVSAVRDLYGTVLNEGANRGILVTTSNYGPDAYKFAQGKPITLLNGGNLLSLLADHGHKARIDLIEAKRLL